MIEKSMTLNIGAASSFKLLHVSDTHLTYTDHRDGERKAILAGRRKAVFPNAEANMYRAAMRAKREHAVIVHTGDLIDFVSVRNLEAAAAFCFDNDVFMCAGNHEFSQYVGEAWEDEAYRNQSLARVQASFNNDIRFSVREIGGVKLIAIDNSYYLFDEAQLAALKTATSDGKPVILTMHNPLYTDELDAFMAAELNDPVTYLCGSPEEKLSRYPEKRAKQQRPDEITLETIEYIKTCKSIRCILAGHIHRDVQTMVTPSLPQFCVGISTSMLINVI